MNVLWHEDTSRHLALALALSLPLFVSETEISGPLHWPLLLAMSSEQKVLTWKQQDTFPTQTASISRAGCACVNTTHFCEQRANAVCKCRNAERDCHFSNVQPGFSQHPSDLHALFQHTCVTPVKHGPSLLLNGSWCLCACVPLREGKRKEMYLWVSLCWDACSCDWSLNPFSTNHFIIFTREIIISLNLPFKRKKKNQKYLWACKSWMFVLPSVSRLYLHYKVKLGLSLDNKREI